jgi:hypothetical protein
MNNPEKLATQSTQDEEKQSKTQHNMCWTPPHANKYKQRAAEYSIINGFVLVQSDIRILTCFPFTDMFRRVISEETQLRVTCN